jgi:hypothetical protein
MTDDWGQPNPMVQPRRMTDDRRAVDDAAVEAVARALAANQERSWDQISPRGREDFLSDAMAAIAAYEGACPTPDRETVAMLVKALRMILATREDDDLYDAEAWERVYRIATDALAELAPDDQGAQDDEGKPGMSERMADGSMRSGLSQDVVSELVRERRDAIIERDQLAARVRELEEALTDIHLAVHTVLSRPRGDG